PVVPAGRRGTATGDRALQIRGRRLASDAWPALRAHRRFPAGWPRRGQPAAVALARRKAERRRPAIPSATGGIGTSLMDKQPNTILHAADVHKNFGGLRALSDIDLQIEEGRTHAIIGPNGAGKSTLLNVVVGRLPPTSGAVIFDGHVLTGKPPHE